MELGIVQGRILKSPLGHQTTHKDWQKEFDIAKQIGIRHIEWNIDFTKNEDNPIFHDDLGYYVNNISSVCFDTAVTLKVFEEEYFLKNIIEPSQILFKKGIRNITIPLLEESEINTDKKLKKAIANINNLKKFIPEMDVNLEMDCSIGYTKKIIENTKCFLTYDTGNLTYKKIDHILYIDNFISKITNVHLKDRSILTGESLSDFSGDTPFRMIIKTLLEKKYKNLYTLQMARNINVSDEELIKTYIKKFRRMYGEFIQP